MLVGPSDGCFYGTVRRVQIDKRNLNYFYLISTQATTKQQDQSMKQVYSVIAALLLVSLAVIANAQMLQMPMQIRPIEKIISQPLLISEYLALKASGSIFDDNNVTESIMGGGMSVTGSYFVEVKIAGNPFRLVVVNIKNYTNRA